MNFVKTALKGAFIIEPTPYEDDRGLFARTFCKREFEQIGHTKEFVQFNHSVNKIKGTLRGMHFQYSPDCEIKLIRCVRGRVFDVIIDIRESSPTFLQHISVELNESNFKSIYVPEGFAHGFQTLENDTHLIYHHTSFYTPDNQGGVQYNDPVFNIQWPLEPQCLTEKDKQHKLVDKLFKGIKI